MHYNAMPAGYLQQWEKHIILCVCVVVVGGGGERCVVVAGGGNEYGVRESETEWYRSRGTRTKIQFPRKHAGPLWNSFAGEKKPQVRRVCVCTHGTKGDARYTTRESITDLICVRVYCCCIRVCVCDIFEKTLLVIYFTGVCVRVERIAERLAFSVQKETKRKN